MKKGFSLFTPLVGTAMIIMAIIISAMMVENDNMTARGITSSFALDNNRRIARAAQAAATVKADENLNEGILQIMHGVDISCHIDAQCVDAFDDRLKADLEAGLKNSIYDGLTDSITASTGTSLSGISDSCNGYPGDNINEKLKNCLSGRIANAGDIFEVEENRDYIINAKQIQYDGLKDAFDIELASRDGQVSVNVLPRLGEKRISGDTLYRIRYSIGAVADKLTQGGTLTCSQGSNIVLDANINAMSCKATMSKSGEYKAIADFTGLSLEQMLRCSGSY